MGLLPPPMNNGKAFHTQKPAAEKLLSPTCVCVERRRSTRTRTEAEGDYCRTIRQIRRCLSSQLLVHQACELKLESSTNKQPVQHLQDSWFLLRKYHNCTKLVFFPFHFSCFLSLSLPPPSVLFPSMFLPSFFLSLPVPSLSVLLGLFLSLPCPSPFLYQTSILRC